MIKKLYISSNHENFIVAILYKETYNLGPPLLTWTNFNPTMGK